MNVLMSTNTTPYITVFRTRFFVHINAIIIFMEYLKSVYEQHFNNSTI